MNDSFKKEAKKSTLLLVIAVAVLIAATFNMTYSSFFSVSSHSSVQQIKAGVLDVILDNPTYGETDMYPADSGAYPTLASSNEDLDNPHGSITLINQGSLDAAYSITLSEDTIPSGEEAIDYEYLEVGVYDVANSAWHNFGTVQSPVYHTSLASLGTNDTFPLLSDVLASGGDTQYRVHLWLSDDVPVTEIGKYIYLKLNVKSVVNNAGGS